MSYETNIIIKNSKKFEKYIKLTNNNNVHRIHKMILNCNISMQENLEYLMHIETNIKEQLSKLKKENKLITDVKRKKALNKEITLLQKKFETINFSKKEVEYNLSRYIKANMTGIYGTLLL